MKRHIWCRCSVSWLQRNGSS